MTQPLPPNTITTLPAAGHPLQNTGGGTLHGDLGVEGTLYLNGNASVSQSLFVDTNSQNNGSNGAGVSLPGLYLGGGPGLTGEYIQSPRTSGSPNQYGIDFVLGWQPRVRINSGGDVSVSGRLTAAELHATGRYFGQGWDMGWPNNFGGNAIFGGVLQCQGRLVTNGYDSGWSNSLGGNVVISGDTIALAANGGIWWRWWGGAWHDFSHGVLTESDLYARGRLVTNNSDWGQNNNLGGHTAFGGRLYLWPGYPTRLEGSPDGGVRLTVTEPADLWVRQDTGTGWGDILAASFQQQCVDHARAFELRHVGVPHAVETVCAITGYSYDHVWLDVVDMCTPQRDASGVILSQPSYGFSASEVQGYLPEVVKPNPETGDPEFVNLAGMVPVLWEAVRQYIARADARFAALEAASAATNGVSA